jgi:hypothetical protein
MSEGWEYMSVLWFYSTKKLETAPEVLRTWRGKYLIYRMGEEPEERVQFDGRDYEEKASFLEVANELGTEGWELATETVLSNTVLSEKLGWSEVGDPIEIRWIFKRRVPTRNVAAD